MAREVGVRVGSLVGVLGTPERVDGIIRCVERLTGDSQSRFRVLLQLLRGERLSGPLLIEALEELEVLDGESAAQLRSGALSFGDIATSGGKPFASLLREYLEFAVEEKLSAKIEIENLFDRHNAKGRVTVTFQDKPERQ